MTTPQIVVLLVALGGSREPSTRAMAAAAQELLEPNALVLVREVPDATLASDGRAIAIADAVHADAVAVLTWPETDQHRAHVHVYAARSSRWVDRELEFRGVDASDERGKALGYAVAAMVPPRHEEAERAPRPSIVRLRPPSDVVAERSAPRARSFALDLAAAGSLGVGGDATGIGGEAGARWTFVPTLALRIGGGFRFGDLPPAGASSSIWRVDGGLAWHPLVTRGARPLAIGIRADAVGLLQTASRPIAAGTTSSGSRWLGGGDALLEAAWAVVPEVALTAAAGVEVDASATLIMLDNRPAATIPRTKILGELGVRALF